MTIYTKNHKKWPLYSRLQKCGEITASTDQNIFGINCIYCSTIFTRLKEFTQHIQNEHRTAIEEDETKELDTEKDEEMPLTIKSEVFAEDDEEDDPFVDGLPLELVTIKEEKPDDESSSDNEGSNIEVDNEVGAGNIIESHDVLTTIIHFYENHSVLWDNKHADYLRARIKVNCLQELANDIEIKHKLKVSISAIRRSFNRLWTLYRNELSGEENTDIQKHEDVAKTTKLWCFEELKFLQKETVPEKRKWLPGLTDNQLIELGKIYQQYPEAWNLDLVESRKFTLKKETLQKMLKKVCSQLKIDMTYSHLILNIRRLKGIYISDKRRRLQCEIENQEFKPANTEIYEQMKYLDSYIGPFRCEECNEIISSYDKFRRHVAAHEGRDSAFQCKLCSKYFRNFVSLEMHLRRHNGITPFQCPMCEYACSNNSDMVKHKRLHTGDKPYVCHLCGKPFYTNSQLCRHLQVHNPETRRFECPHCPKKYSSKEKLNNHINAHLQKREHVCETCGKGFFSVQTLRQHMQLHSDVKKYSCDTCGKKFKQLQAMYSHKKTHI